MWRRSASFILDKQQSDTEPSQRNPSDTLTLPSSPPLSMADTLQNPPNNISAYYQTRAAHNAVVTSDWLAQAQAAIGHDVDDAPETTVATVAGKPFSVIDEFNSWRKQPELAEAVAAIRALAAVIRNCQATTMMELEIELKKASDSLKVSVILLLLKSFV